VHQAITPVMVAPGQHAVIPLEPACITPPEGQAQQECEQVAAKRKAIISNITMAMANST
jgi:hypothetical protein